MRTVAGRVVATVLTAMGPTAELGAAALAISLVIAVPAGVVSASRRGGLADHGASLLALAGLSVLSFWLAILLILGFSVHHKWLPSFPGGATFLMVLGFNLLGDGLRDRLDPRRQ